MPFCSPSSNGCFNKQMAKDYKCLDACFGLYADVTYINSTEKISLEETKDFSDLRKEYNEYKNKFLDNINFDPWKENYGKFMFYCHFYQIYFKLEESKTESWTCFTSTLTRRPTTRLRETSRTAWRINWDFLEAPLASSLASQS